MTTDMQHSLGPYKPRFLDDLVRIGHALDGGYLVNERAVRQSRYLLSFGLCEDWSFEADFLNRKPDIRILCFDNSVSKDVFRDKIFDALHQILSVKFVIRALSLKLQSVRDKFWLLKRSIKNYFYFSRFFAGENIHFFAMGISSEKTKSFVTINDVFQMIPRDELSENSVFVKMDIEQSEFRVLPELMKLQRYINSMVVEFHDLDILWPNFSAIMDELQEHFEVTHIHGNNYSGLIPDSTTPKVLEVTLLNRTLLEGGYAPRASPAYPIPGLDYPNNPREKDYPLQFEQTAPGKTVGTR